MLGRSRGYLQRRLNAGQPLVECILAAFDFRQRLRNCIQMLLVGSGHVPEDIRQSASANAYIRWSIRQIRAKMLA
jgi:hypothetical protein